LLILLLRDLGLEARAYIPDRLMEGYGPSGEALVRLKAKARRLIVTVDCGAQAFEALEMARDAGADVIVVDHHKCASELPMAHALVNPNRLDEAEGAAHGHLAAVGVAFLLGAALIRTLRARGYFAEPRRAAAARPARPRRARHRRRRRLAQGPQPRLRGAGPQGDGASAATSA
jgi:single-stranded-DNA-specific exonuclease